jgi:hypothetical protein
MAINLNGLTEVSHKDYLHFKEPAFEGQTKVNKEGQYWMVFQTKEQGLVKIKNTL